MRGPHSGSLPTEDPHLLSGSHLQGGKDGVILLATLSHTCSLLMSPDSTLFHQKIILADFLSLTSTMLVAMTKQRRGTDRHPGRMPLVVQTGRCCLWTLTYGGCPGAGRREQGPTTWSSREASQHQSGPGLHPPHPHQTPNDANVPGTCGEAYGIAMGLDQPPL